MTGACFAVESVSNLGCIITSAAWVSNLSLAGNTQCSIKHDMFPVTAKSFAETFCVSASGTFHLSQGRSDDVCSAQAIIDDPLMRHSAVLVFANKQDLVGPLPQFCKSMA